MNKVDDITKRLRSKFIVLNETLHGDRLTSDFYYERDKDGVQ